MKHIKLVISTESNEFIALCELIGNPDYTIVETAIFITKVTPVLCVSLAESNDIVASVM